MATRPKASMAKSEAGLWLLFLIASPFVGGWALMLGIGVLHHEWWSAVPTIGYWPAVFAWMAFAYAAKWTRSYEPRKD